MTTFQVIETGKIIEAQVFTTKVVTANGDEYAMSEVRELPFMIERDGSFFRALDTVTKSKSQLVTSISQAGLLIRRKGGEVNQLRALEAFRTLEGK